MRVTDVMIPLRDYAVIGQGASLREAMRVLREAAGRLTAGRQMPRAILVVDEHERAVGVLEHLDILRALEPRYNMMGDLDILSRAGVSNEVVNSLFDNLQLWQGSLDDACARAARTPVAALMKPITDCIDEHATLQEALHRLLIGNTIRLLVNDADKIVGVVRAADIVGVVEARMMALTEDRK